MAVPIKARILTRWLNALKHRRMKLGRAIVYSPETGAFCALGFLSKIAADAGVVTFNPDACGSPAFGEGNTALPFLTPEVVEWAGLPKTPEAVAAMWAIVEANDDVSRQKPNRAAAIAAISKLFTPTYD